MERGRRSRRSWPARDRDPGTGGGGRLTGYSGADREAVALMLVAVAEHLRGNRQVEGDHVRQDQHLDLSHRPHPCALRRSCLWRAYRHGLRLWA